MNCKNNLIWSFIIEQLGVRGRIIHLSSELDKIIKQHAYPYEASNLIAQTTALTALMGNSLKMRAIFSIQIRANGLVQFITSDFSSNGDIRSYAKFDSEIAEKQKEEHGKIPANELLRTGSMTLTINHLEQDQIYQAITPLEGKDLDEIATNYYNQSEQLPTYIKIFSEQKENSNWVAGGFFLQRMPGNSIAMQGESEQERDNKWKEAEIIARTITPQELLDHNDVCAHTLLFRLYHEYEVKIFEPLKLQHKCSCSRDRSLEILNSFNKDQLEQSIEDNKISMTCSFCSAKYEFDPQEISSYKK